MAERLSSLSGWRSVASRRRDQWLAGRLAELEPAERDVLRHAVSILEKVNHA